jgi:hypothetical protein
MLAAAPAYPVVGSVICVQVTDPSCTDTKSTIGDAITTANANSVADTILVGPGTYKGPFQLDGTAHGIILQGSGPATVITADPGGMQSYVFAGHATVRDLAVTFDPAVASSSAGIFAADGSVVENVTVTGPGSFSVNGLHVQDSQVVSSTVVLPLGSDSRGVYSEGNTTITDTALTADTGVYHSGLLPTVVSRTSIHGPTYAGVWTDGGSVDIDNSLVDLGSTAGTGLLVSNENNSTSAKTINADHVTIVGGDGSSVGAWAWAAKPTARQLATVRLSNSIVRGPATSLVADAGNNGSQGGSSSAAVDVDHTDYQTTGGTIGANGTGGVVDGGGNLSNVDPSFVNAASGDYHLAFGSPVIDKGDPAAGLPEDVDLDGNARVVDGDGNGTAIRDLGAYEWADLLAPETTLTGGPSGAIQDTTPTFTFTSEAGASFSCQVDAGAYTACTSPFTTPVLANGAHTFRVRSTDAANNTDATPAARSFTVDTVAPNSTITKKPAKRITTRRARFAFTSSEAGSVFQCRVDNGAWKACASPKVIRVKRGWHVFRVRAVDPAGNVDATPASYRFRRI